MQFANSAALAAALFAVLECYANCALYLNRKFETSFFCWGWIVLNLFLNFEKNEPRVLII